MLIELIYRSGTVFINLQPDLPFFLHLRPLHFGGGWLRIGALILTFFSNPSIRLSNARWFAQYFRSERMNPRAPYYFACESSWISFVKIPAACWTKFSSDQAFLFSFLFVLEPKYLWSWDFFKSNYKCTGSNNSILALARVFLSEFVIVVSCVIFVLIEDDKIQKELPP